jgi:glycosyltransferase involved in cell wall biosynthesis
LANWHIITGEYPPQPGGVSDYTWLVAHGLVAHGNAVHVWAPECGRSDEKILGLAIHRLPGHFGPRALVHLGNALPNGAGDLALVQYVPHAYGLKAMNLPFCLWLNTLRARDITVMFHEVVFPIQRGQPLRHQMLGAVTRIMAWLVGHSATRIMVASARAENFLRRLGISAPIAWVPVPSNIPVIADEAEVRRLRATYAGRGELLLGHFSNYSEYSVRTLRNIISDLFGSNTRLSLLLLGGNSDQFRQKLLSAHPNAAGRIQATGRLEPKELSCALSACDLMIQPFEDGVSTRRTSLMAGLVHGRAIVTTSGTSTEALWPQSGAVALAPAGDAGAIRNLVAKLVADPQERCRYTNAARQLYEQRFAVRHTIAALLDTTSSSERAKAPARRPGINAKGFLNSREHR